MAQISSAEYSRPNMLLLHFATEIVEVELAGSVAAMLHHAGGVSVGRVEVVRGDGDAELAEVAQEAAVSFDVLVAAR